MSVSNKVRVQRALREAEGYLELGLPASALSVLDRITDPGTFRAQKLYLAGEALRALERYDEAVAMLEQAVEQAPSNILIWLALGWCYKRTGRLELAIQSLQQAHDVEPGEAIVHYNLACYWSLAGDKHRALSSLRRAITLEPHYRELIGEESDFDPLRADPDFLALTNVSV